MKIYREEIYLQILEENKSAAAELPNDLEGVAKAWADKKKTTLGILSSTKKKGSKEED